jgi:exo-beta-1,3-glucanase (GH17 family)
MVKVIISETGWPGKGETQSAVPSSDNDEILSSKHNYGQKMLM